MNVMLRRIVALLMILALSVSLMPTVFAAETDVTESDDLGTLPQESMNPTDAVTEPTVTDPAVPPQTESEQETNSTEATDLEITQPATEPEQATESEPSVPQEMTPEVTDNVLMTASNDGIATVATGEIIGNPTTFASLFLWEAIQIPSFGRLQRKEHIPLYSVYLRNQPGYENNYYIAYCVEPGIVQSASANYGGNSSTLGGLDSGATIYTYLSPAELRAMGVALLYGQMEIARRADEESVRLNKLRRWAATQIIIWEIAAGWRSTIPPYTRSNDTLYDAVTPTLEIASTVWGNHFTLSDITSAYDEIEEKMAKHYIIPSFSSDQMSMAPSYELTPTGSDGYTITLTDTNNILSAYTFRNTDQLTFSVSGNRLTIRVSGDVTGDIVVSPTKNIPNLDTQVFWVWENGSNQRMMSLKTDPTSDPVPCYFKLNVANSGTLDLIKSTEDDQNLGGWMFEFYSDEACTSKISGPYTTDSSGRLSVTDLAAGTVYVKEVGNTDPAIDALYLCSSHNPQEVTITSGETAQVSFYNELARGIGQIKKVTTNGGPLAGWNFEVKDSSGTVVGNYVTDSTGVIVLDLKPGTYTVTELNTPEDYWISDPIQTKTLTVNAGETSVVSFRNQYIGKAKIVKVLQNPEYGTVAGWTFELKLASGMSIGEHTTDASGVILLDMEPGTYTVTELLEEDSNWQCVTDVTQTVIVEPGKTAEVRFVNAWKSTEILVYKVNTLGVPLSDAEFLLEWSEDGSNWKLVTYTDSGNMVKGGCTSSDLADGKLITGQDGVVHFTGLNPDVQYRLTETKAPAGYQLLTEPAFEGKIPTTENRIVELTVTNAYLYELPMTGSTGSTIQTCLQVAGACVLLDLLLCFTKKRR